MKTERLWGKRFGKKLAALAEALTSGRDVRGVPAADERLIPYDLWGSRAHVVMLAKQKIIPRREARLLVRGLREIEKAWRKGSFKLDPAKEDVHSNVEAWLIAKSGQEVGGRLHTARSRNDQVALDMRLYLRDCALDFISNLISLSQILIQQAQRHSQVLTPGYSHHQPAQITTLGHVWVSFAEPLQRDLRRFQNWYGQFNRNPLGSMTGYGTSFPIDRHLTSKLLGFDGPCANSLDPIQNRWEAEAELGFAICTMMNHLSSLAQTLILFCGEEFGLLRLDDAYSTGSSMMPQKRNPDPLEAVKAKAAVAQGLLAALLSIGKSLFLGYNRDTQWTKYLIMDLVDEGLLAPAIMGEIIGSLQVEKKRAEFLCKKGFIAAPDLLEYIVQEGNLPFRKAKVALEKAVQYSERGGAREVTPSALKKAFQEEGLKFDFPDSFVGQSQEARFIIEKRGARGGPSASSLRENIGDLISAVQDSRQWLRQKRRQKSLAQIRLTEMEESL